MHSIKEILLSLLALGYILTTSLSILVIIIFVDDFLASTIKVRAYTLTRLRNFSYSIIR